MAANTPHTSQSTSIDLYNNSPSSLPSISTPGTPQEPPTNHCPTCHTPLAPIVHRHRHRQDNTTMSTVSTAATDDSTRTAKITSEWMIYNSRPIEDVDDVPGLVGGREKREGGGGDGGEGAMGGEEMNYFCQNRECPEYYDWSRDNNRENPYERISSYSLEILQSRESHQGDIAHRLADRSKVASRMISAYHGRQTLGSQEEGRDIVVR